MTEIAPELATFVRESKPGSNDYYKTAQDTLRVAFGVTSEDAHAYLRWRVAVPQRLEVVSLFMDVFFEADSGIGAGVLQARLMKVNGPTYRQMTWNNVPAVAPDGVDFTGVVSGRRVRFDLTSAYGSLTLDDGSVSPWLSFRFKRAVSAGITRLVGPKGGRYAPQMVLVTQPREFDPSDLSPVGNVGILKPTVEWTAPLGVSHKQVQVDELGGDFSTPLYDSGELPASSSASARNRQTHNTATGPVWAGVPVAGAPWRVRHKMAGAGWSGWVEGEFAYVAKSSPVLTDPLATDADPTPPLTWDLPADSARVLVTRGNRVVEDVLLPGPVSSYTPSKGAVVDGETVRREVRWFDGVDRAPSLGDPAWVLLSRDTVWEKSSTVPPMSSLQVWQDGESPMVFASADRSVGLPDEGWFGWDGTPGQLVDGVDGLTVRDWTVPPNTPIEYASRAVVNRKHSRDVWTQVRTRVRGVFLVDVPTERGLRLAGTDGLEIASGEVVVVNEPISAATLIRTTLMLRGEQGSVSGQFTDWPGRTLEQQRADALWMREQTEREYRLIMGDLNIPVTVTMSKPVFDPQVSRHDRLFHNISFTFSHAGDDE